MTREPGRRVPGFVRAWEEFWFREIPPHTYACLRIALGAVGLLGLLSLTPISLYWPLDSVVPPLGGGVGFRALLANAGLGTLAGWSLFAVLVVAFACMTAGFLTAPAVAACFLASVTQAMWNPLPLASSHRVLICLLFCLVWADCGRVLSVDTVVFSKRQRAPWTTGAMWPLRLMRVQVALIYLNSGLSKLSVPEWRDGSAVYYALNSNAFQRFPGGIPASFEWLTTTATYVTLLWELGFAFMLLRPWSRKVALGLGVATHVGMAIMMELGTFSWVMLASYLAFVDPQRLQAILGSSPLQAVRTPLDKAKAL